MNEDILVVSHSNGMYYMYSLHWILEHCSIIVKPTIGQLVEVGGSMGQVGAPGFGVPITVKLTGTFASFDLQLSIGTAHIDLCTYMYI